jgi:hypothetical protein
MVLVRGLVVAMLLGVSPSVSRAGPVDRAVAPTVPGAPARDPLIRLALDWLPRQPDVPIEVVDVDRLAAVLQRGVRTACAFVIRGVPRIYVSSRCPAYRRAAHNPLDAIGLAAVIGHEMAHLDGADEVSAREVEVGLVQRLSATLPGEYRVRVALYVDGLRRRRAPAGRPPH